MATKKYLIKRMKALNISGDIAPFETEKDYWKRKAVQIKVLSKRKKAIKKVLSKKRKPQSKRMKALKRNVKRRKGKYATARDQELMFGY